MKKSTINNLIDLFNDSCSKEKDTFHKNYSTMDDIMRYSKDYVAKLDLETFEKELFRSYFESQMISMYRSDFEKESLREELENFARVLPPKKYPRLIHSS